LWGQARRKNACNYCAEPLYDPRCHVIQALDVASKPIATLVNDALHPEVLGNRRALRSPDLAGPLYDRMAERGGGTALLWRLGLVTSRPVGASLVGTIG
jgi:hypothetical protein